MADHIFAYGSLMFSPVWERVVRGVYPKASARLRNHGRYAVRNEHYPGVVACAGEHVDGCVYFNVAPNDLYALDQFEERKYARSQVIVQLEAGKTLQAWVYLFLPRDRLTASPWDPAHFETFNMRAFLASYPPARHPSAPTRLDDALDLAKFAKRHL